MRIAVQCATVALVACAQVSDNASQNLIEKTAIPRDHTTGFRDGYLVRVPRSGPTLWNGQDVSLATLKRYIGEYSRMPGNAGRLWIEVEPGTSSNRAEAVRRLIIESGLCRQQRCVEADWNVKRPVVH